MSELALTLLRSGFLLLLWIGVLLTISVLRRDLRAPREIRPAPITAPKPTLAPAAPRRGRQAKGKRLVVIEGPLAGTIVPLGAAPITIGRAQDSTLVLEDDYASTHHCRISNAGGEWVVEDLNSTNGTWLDKTRITRPSVLPIGVPLRVGRSVMRVEK